MYVFAPAAISCLAARAIMVRYSDDHGPCSGSSCFRTYPGGWVCDSVTPGYWPIVQECSRGAFTVIGRVRSAIKGPR
jgi:hypothetical protein